MTDHLNPTDAAAFARLSRELAGEPDTTQTVQRVVELARQSIPGCDYAGFTLTRPDRLETAAATDPLIADSWTAPSTTWARGRACRGPLTEQTCLIRDTGAESRWPRWWHGRRGGVRSVLSVQLTGQGRLHAAMNLYAKRPTRTTRMPCSPRRSTPPTPATRSRPATRASSCDGPEVAPHIGSPRGC